jgi:hypothetical protein
MITGLCVVVVEVIVSDRPRRAVGSARITRRSSIACAKSSKMLLLPALAGADPSARPPAADPAATSHVFRPPRTAIRAPRRVTWKKPRNRGRSDSRLNTNCIFAGNGRSDRGALMFGRNAAFTTPRGRRYGPATNRTGGARGRPRSPAPVSPRRQCDGRSGRSKRTGPRRLPPSQPRSGVPAPRRRPRR